MEVTFVNSGATVPIQLNVQRDDGASAAVGSAITAATVPASQANGLARSFWTLNAADTCLRARPIVSVTTTAGYTNTVSNDSELRIVDLTVHAHLRPVGARQVNVVINTTDQYSNDVFQEDAGMDPKMIRDTLRALERGAPVTATDPDGNSVAMFVTDVSDADIRIGDSTHYVITLTGITWVNSG
jgi:hypothetical protein